MLIKASAYYWSQVLTECSCILFRHFPLQASPEDCHIILISSGPALPHLHVAPFPILYLLHSNQKTSRDTVLCVRHYVKCPCLQYRWNQNFPSSRIITILNSKTSNKNVIESKFSLPFTVHKFWTQGRWKCRLPKIYSHSTVCAMIEWLYDAVITYVYASVQS